jgi:tetratricopeptide (TPR) repeat protein
VLILSASAAVAISLVWFYQPRTAGGTIDHSVEEALPIEAPPALPADDMGEFRARLGEAEKKHTEIAVKPPNAPEAMAAAGMAFAAHDFLAALDLFKISISLQPTFAAYDGVGRSALKLGLLTESLDAYRRIIALDPHNAAGYVGEAKALKALGRREESQKALETGAAAVPPGDLAGRLVLLGEFEQRVELPRALTEAQQLAKQFPQEPEALRALARILSKVQRISDAQSLLDKRLLEAPDDLDAKRQLGSVLLNRLNPHRDRDRAEELLMEVLKKDAGSRETFLALGELYTEEESYRKAAFITIKLLGIAPDMASARLLLARALSHLPDSNYRAIEADQRKIAEGLLARDRIDERLAFEKDARPMDAGVRLELARHFEKTGRFARALPEYEAAWALSPPGSVPRREPEQFCAKFGITLMESGKVGR